MKAVARQTAPANIPAPAASAPTLIVVQRADLNDMLVDICAKLARDPDVKLLDRNGLARALSVSVSKVDQLRHLEGFPVVRLGPASERYEIDAVLDFLRTGAAAHLGAV